MEITKREVYKHISKLKFAQINDFESLLNISIFIDSCLPFESDESDAQVLPFEIFEFIDVSFSALRDTLSQLRSSPDFEHVSTVSPETTVLELTVDK